MWLIEDDDLYPWFSQRAKRAAFRVELLDSYDVDSDGDDYARYLAGEPDLTHERKQPWLEQLRKEKAEGFLRHRVHILRSPLSGYLRYECEWGYLPNAEAGEGIFIVDVAEQPDPEIGVDHDFWILTDEHGIEHVLVMHYDQDGRFLGGEPMPQTALPLYRQARERALAAAEPFTDWWSRHTNEWRKNSAA